MQLSFTRTVYVSEFQVDGALYSAVFFGEIDFRKLFIFVLCLTSQQHANVSQEGICSDNFICCHTEAETVDQTFYLTQSQYTDTWPISPNASAK